MITWQHYDESPGAGMGTRREGGPEFRQALSSGSLFGGQVVGMMPAAATRPALRNPARNTARNTARKPSRWQHWRQMPFDAYLRYCGKTPQQFKGMTFEEQVEIHQAWLAERDTLAFLRTGETLVKYVFLAIAGMVAAVLTRGWWG